MEGGEGGGQGRRGGVAPRVIVLGGERERDDGDDGRPRPALNPPPDVPRDGWGSWGEMGVVSLDEYSNIPFLEDRDYFRSRQYGNN